MDYCYSELQPFRYPMKSRDKHNHVIDIILVTLTGILLAGAFFHCISIIISFFLMQSESKTQIFLFYPIVLYVVFPALIITTPILLFACLRSLFNKNPSEHIVIAYLTIILFYVVYLDLVEQVGSLNIPYSVFKIIVLVVLAFVTRIIYSKYRRKRKF